MTRERTTRVGRPRGGMKVAARIGEGLRREIERGRQTPKGGRRLAPHLSLKSLCGGARNGRDASCERFEDSVLRRDTIYNTYPNKRNLVLAKKKKPLLPVAAALQLCSRTRPLSVKEAAAMARARGMGEGSDGAGARGAGNFFLFAGWGPGLDPALTRPSRRRRLHPPPTHTT